MEFYIGPTREGYQGESWGTSGSIAKITTRLNEETLTRVDEGWERQDVTIQQDPQSGQCTLLTSFLRRKDHEALKDAEREILRAQGAKAAVDAVVRRLTAFLPNIAAAALVPDHPGLMLVSFATHEQARRAQDAIAAGAGVSDLAFDVPEQCQDCGSPDPEDCTGACATGPDYACCNVALEDEIFEDFPAYSSGEYAQATLQIEAVPGVTLVASDTTERLIGLVEQSMELLQQIVAMPPTVFGKRVQ